MDRPDSILKFHRFGEFFAFYRMTLRYGRTEILATVDMIASRFPPDPGPDGDGGLPIEEAA